MIGGKLGIVELLVLLVISAVFLLPWWKIFSKSGHHGALSLTMLIPGVSFFVLMWFAFTEWPIERRLRETAQR